MSSSSGGLVPGDVTTPNPLHNTSKYKVYVQAVDRALKTFENPNEWADLISALAKLAKVFQSNAKFGDIPKPVTVAKRLSQCLHPALPMGVHLKALETYRQIFDILGPQSLPKLLYLFAVGLFPLMDHCGIKVKSELFNIFEQYLLPLGQNLRPALPGFLAGVLLGLEEGTEFYDRSLSVLDRVCEGVGERAFFACLWQAVLGSPSVRLPAMLYVNAKFDKTRSLDDQIAIVGDHVNHMVAALCAVANDSGSPLVQRNLLDFLCAAFPLDSTNLTSDDFVQNLAVNAVYVRRTSSGYVPQSTPLHLVNESCWRVNSINSPKFAFVGYCCTCKIEQISVYLFSTKFSRCF
ncbi:Dopey protein [Ancylostoma duodenale]|uniref:Dopey protein n=1 Tax=Ancylostoma duodenale TaxID=51022 RepID=A0A0C2GXU2_9BILA|nr:Dopey protein [Ancylostoma duodenale]